MIITGVKKSVLTAGWVPRNWRRAFGLFVGIPLSALSAGGVIASSVLTGNGLLSAGLGALLIVVCGLGVLGSLGYLLWALTSKPKPRKEESDRAGG